MRTTSERTETASGPIGTGLLAGLVLALGVGAAAGYGAAQLGGADERPEPLRAAATDPACPPGHESRISSVDDGPPDQRRMPMELVRQKRDMVPYTLEEGDFARLTEVVVPAVASAGPEGRVAVTVPGRDGRTVAVFTYTAFSSGWWLSQTSECARLR